MGTAGDLRPATDETFRISDRLAKRYRSGFVHTPTSGSWGSALAYASATISINTAYTLKVARRQTEIKCVIAGQSATAICCDSATDFGTGKSGLYASHSDIKFDNFKADRGAGPLACARGSDLLRPAGAD